MSSGNPSVRLAHGGEHQGVNDIPKELLRAINMDDSSEHPSDSAGGLGNMPELTLLLEDDEVIKRFSVSQITVNLRTCCCAWVIIYYAPGSLARGIMHWWPSSVCLSICLVPDPESKTEGHSKLRFVGKEAHDTGDPLPHLMRPLSAVIEISHIFGVGRPTNFDLGIQMEFDDPHHRHARWPQRWRL